MDVGHIPISDIENMIIYEMETYTYLVAKKIKDEEQQREKRKGRRK